MGEAVRRAEAGEEAVGTGADSAAVGGVPGMAARVVAARGVASAACVVAAGRVAGAASVTEGGVAGAASVTEGGVAGATA